MMSSEASHADQQPILQIENLQTHFRTDTGLVKAVDGASFSVPRGKSVCVVGESGCGKSVTTGPAKSWAVGSGGARTPRQRRPTWRRWIPAATRSEGSEATRSR